MLVVEKFPNANTLEVTRDVEAALDAMRPGLAGVELDTRIFRPASFIEQAIDNLALALVAGLLLLALALVALLFDWRAALIGLVSVPAAVLAAVLVLAVRGETMNALALAGLLIALAVVVDDAIVGVEHVRRRLREQREAGDERSAAAVVYDASLEIRRPLGYATLVVLVATLPIFVVGGQSGDFFEPLAVSYALAVLASMLVALTLGPALALTLLAKGPGSRESPILRQVRGRYDDALGRALRRPRPLLVGAAVVGLAGLALVPLFDQSVVPTFKERDLLVHVDGAPGTSRPEMTRIARRLSRELRSLDGVEGVGAHVGRAVMSDHALGVHSGELWVRLTDGAAYDTTVDRIRGVVDGYPGLEGDLVAYSSDRIRTVGSVADGKDEDDDRITGLSALRGDDEPLLVRVYGTELDELRRKAAEVAQLIGQVDGVVDPRVERQTVEPTLEIEPNLDASRRHGIKPGDIRRAAATLVQGIEVGSLFEGQKVFDVIVVGVPEIRHSVASIRDLLVDKPGGGQVRLAEVADVRVAPAPVSIEREATSRRIDVGADVSGRDLDAVIGDVERTLDQVRFPLEYHAEVLTASREREAARTRTLLVAASAAAAVLLLLQAALGSWRLALLFFVSLPVALAGGLVAARLVGDSMSLGALGGLLAVAALAVRNGVLLIDRYRRLSLERGRNGIELILEGTRERLPAIVTSALATALALLPLVVLGERPGYEIAHPLAAVLVGGLITSTAFTLFVVPALYLVFGAAERAPAGDVVEELRPSVVRPTQGVS
jgi:Cu/Ag efflux pump CusA